MKTFIEYFLLPAVFILILNCEPGLSQDKEWGPGNKYNRLYDTKTVVTLSGEISAVNKYYNDKGLGYGLHFDLKTGDENIIVHVGPGWYIEDKGFEFSVNDQVTVTGSKVLFNGKDVIIASEITKDTKVLKLRDSNGNPLWIGWGCVYLY